MSALELATTTAFSGLGLVALALALLTRHTSRAGFGIGLAGLMVLAASTTWLARNRPVDLGATVSRLTSENEAFRRENEALKRALADMEQRLAAAAADDKSTPVKLAQPDPQPETAPPPAAAQMPCTQPDTPSVPPAPMPPEAGPDPGGRAHLMTLLAKRIETPFYRTEPTRPLVSGLAGHWYTLRLRVDEAPLAFADRKFHIDNAESKIGGSAAHLVSDILEPVARRANAYRLYVRGYADARRVVHATDLPPIRDLEQMPRGGDGLYQTDSDTRRIGDKVVNDDLPALRADWLRRTLAPRLPGSPASETLPILANPPGDGTERTAELVLFVAW